MIKSKCMYLVMALILFLLFMPVCTLAAGRWVTFAGADSTQGFDVTTIVSNFQEVIADVTIAGMMVKDRVQEGVAYQELTVPGAGHTGDIGQARLPMISRYVEVPDGATARVQVIEQDDTLIDGYHVYPLQPPITVVEQVPSVEFALDTSAYARDAYLPNQIAQLEGPYVIRGRSMVLVQVFPVQFNPERQSLRVMSRIRIRIEFEGGYKSYGNRRLRSSSFDKTYDRLLLNKAQSPTRLYAYAASDEGNLLLMITHPDFLEAAEVLAIWKREKGIYTEVRTTEQTGGSATEIQSYIQNAYETWDLPPTYVMLIGDADFIPTHYVMPHPSDSSDFPLGRTGTDIYYTTVDGSDYFPDISLGRVSVDTPAQANKRINDIIRYEKTPVESRSFYENIALLSHFQHAEDGRANYRFAQTSEDLAIFISDPDYLGDYAVDRIYAADESVFPLNWCTVSLSNGFINFGGGPAGEPGDPIPSYLRKDIAPYFQWDGDHVQITNAINAGRFLVVHRDHGSRTGWGHPQFDTSHVNALSNGDLMPVVWSINCQTGWFDNETDDLSSTAISEVNFTEAWERNPQGGAIGVIGASRVSYSGHNDHMMWGWTDAIWPDFLTYTPSGTPFDGPIREMGPALNYGKYYYATIYPESVYRQTQFEIFHWFGDPTMEIRTAVPQSLTVAHDSNLSAGATSIDVSVSDSAEALICVTKDGHILARRKTTGGTSTLTWSTPLEAGEEILVTVTGHDRIAYQQKATAIDYCECNLDNDTDCDGSDWLLFSRDWGRSDCDLPEAESCKCDLNNDGACDLDDWHLFVPDWGREDCPIRPPTELIVVGSPINFGILPDAD